MTKIWVTGALGSQASLTSILEEQSNPKTKVFLMKVLAEKEKSLWTKIPSKPKSTRPKIQNPNIYCFFWTPIERAYPMWCPEALERVKTCHA